MMRGSRSTEVSMTISCSTDLGSTLYVSCENAGHKHGRSTSASYLSLADVTGPVFTPS
jgi:hypothetical protein